MSDAQFVTILAVSSLSLVASAASLIVMMVGAKKVEVEIQEVRTKSNKALNKLKESIADLSI